MEITQILSAMEQGDPQAGSQLLPVVYGELRRLAAQRLAREQPGQTLEATALVHEAYLRLVGGDGRNPDGKRHWDSRGHFFAAAAQAMRRILVERARSRATLKRGGEARKLDLDLERIGTADDGRAEELLALDEALGQLAKHDAQAARLVELRYFAGLTHQQAAEAIGVSRRAADRLWALARAWLFQRLNEG